MKKYLIALVILVVVATVSGAIYWKFNNSKEVSTACTEEAKLCPDGTTSVGRQGPNCEFEACPVTTSASATSTSTASSDKCKGLSEEKCYTDTSNRSQWINQDNPANWPTYESKKAKVSLRYRADVWSPVMEGKNKPAGCYLGAFYSANYGGKGEWSAKSESITLNDGKVYEVKRSFGDGKLFEVTIFLKNSPVDLGDLHFRSSDGEISDSCSSSISDIIKSVKRI